MSVESGDLWRVAAMTAMPKAKLAALLCEPSGSAAWVQAAAALDIPEALVRLGRMHLEGYGVAKDHRAAFGCFGRAARAGDIEAENMLGRCYENGWGVATDFARAALHYRRAAEDGHAWAQYNLGHLLLDGNGVAEDKAAAFGWYMRAAAQGHARAMNLVARCYEAGWGTARDAEKGRALYRRSAEGGYFRGAYNYACLLAAEGCVMGALHWFRSALSAAPEPTRTNMRRALARHPEAQVRALAA